MLRIACVAIGIAMASTVAKAQSYPIVFDDKALLREVGVTVKDVGPQPDVPEFEEKCYYYGDGGIALSLSPDLVSAYQAKGFSAGALCLGMLSGVRFHPMTGARLATFVVADVEMIRQYGPDPFALSSEITLEVPDCFAAGKPMSDCAWVYDPMTGGRISQSGLDYVARVAAEADRVGREAVASGDFDRVCGPDETSGCRIDKYPDAPDYAYIKGRRARELYAGVVGRPVSFYDISDEFPGGYGYALYADGAAGPSAELDSAKIALDPKKRASLAVIEGLKLKLR